LYLLKEAATDDMAVCLDGTPGGYYYRASPILSPDANKWYIHHQGGGWCESMSDCYARSLTPLGSSSSYPATMSLNGDYFSPDPSVNPMMWDWNMVYIQYCDGASFSGSNSTVTNYQGDNLYFRGAHILNAVIVDLLTNRGLNMATDVVISGCSAGGLSTFLHVDEWRAAIPVTARVVGMPDSGFFLDFETEQGYQSGMQWSFMQQNASSGVDQDCIADWTAKGQAWRCMFAQHTVHHVQTPIFPLQSEYDSWQIYNILGSNSTALVNPYGALLTSLIYKHELASNRNGVYLDSCTHHCTSGMWNSMHTNGVTMAQAFAMWYNNVEYIWQQGQSYPCVSCCN